MTPARTTELGPAERPRRVAITLVNFNGYRNTCEAIDSIRPHVDPRDALVVVDNASTDRSVERLRERYPDVTVLSLDRNRGYSGGCNAAIEHASRGAFRYVLLANNDVLFHPDSIERLVETAEGDRRIAVVVPRIYYADRPERVWAAGSTLSRLTGLTRQRGMGEEESVFPPASGPLDLEMCTGCALLARTSLVESVGGMREQFFLYYDETDLCWRIRQAGFRIVLDDRARVWHKVSASVGESSPLFWYHLVRNHILFVHLNFPAARRLFALVYLTAILNPHRVLDQMVTGHKNQAMAIVRGVVSGYRAMVADSRRDGRTERPMGAKPHRDVPG